MRCKAYKKIIRIADKLQIGLNCNQELVYIAVCEVESDIMEVLTMQIFFIVRGF